MSESFCFAHLKTDSPFFDLFVGGRVPIESSSERPVRLEREGVISREPVYFVHLPALTHRQFESIVLTLVQRSGEKPWVIRKELRERGLPLRKSQVAAVQAGKAFAE